MRTPLLVIGAGGHARVVVALVRRTGEWEACAVLDRTTPERPEQIDGITVTGGFEKAGDFLSTGVRHAAIAVGDNTQRATLLSHFSALGFVFPALRHPSAVLEDNVQIGAGSLVCAGAIVGAQVLLGRGVLINTGAIVDHESTVGDCAHIAPGCRVAGRVTIGQGVMLGIGTCVREKITIGNGSIIGAGSVVVDNIPANVMAYGTPARVIRPYP